MTPIIGNAIVIAVLCFVVFLAGKKTIQIFMGELSGKGCSGCPGGCNGKCGGCSTDNKKK